MELKAAVMPSLVGTQLRLETEISVDSQRSAFYGRVIELEDTAIRESLIRLGWTPPLSKQTPTAYMKEDSPILGHTDFMKHEDWMDDSLSPGWIALYTGSVSCRKN